MNFRIIITMILSVLLFAACKKDKKTIVSPPQIDKVKIGETSFGAGIKAQLWADADQFKTGYNKLYVRLLNADGEAINESHLSMQPIMQMAGMSHSCPVEQLLYNTENDLYESAAVFTMAGDWDLVFSLNGEDVAFAVNVEEASTKVTGFYTGTDGNTYILTLIPENNWTVGLNDFQILLHKMESDINFSTVDGMTIEFTPEMISMGHGSPNNVNPISIGDGYYNGKVNFTMTGDWRFHFKLKNATTTIVDDAFVDILL